MKNIIQTLIILNSTFIPLNAVFAQNIGINGTGAAANPSALLDVDDAGSNTKGVLIPRIPLTAINVAAPVTSPATSLLVYNTASASTGTNAVSPGYYYWDGTKWVRFAYTPSGSSANAWTILGNGGTNPSTNFLGTTDAQDLVFRTNNLEAVRITTAGNVGIGTSTPIHALHVKRNDGNSRIVIERTDNTAGGTLVLEQSGGNTTAGLHHGSVDGYAQVSGVRQWTSRIAFNTRSANTKEAEIVFHTSDGVAGSPPERMRINYLGNVGIGTNLPMGRLHVFGGDAIVADNVQANFNVSRTSQFLYVDNIKGWSDNGVRIYDGNTNGYLDINNVSDTYIQSHSTSGVPSGTLNESGGATDISYSTIALNPYGGNVGVGSTAPLAKLQINGVGNTTYNNGLSVKSPNANQALDVMPGYALTNSTAAGIQEDLTMTIRSSGSFAGNLALATGNEERLRITPIGFVGVGTYSPTLKLHLHDAAQNFHALRFTSGTTQTNYWDLVKRGEAYSAGQNHNFVIAFNGSEKLSITSAGDIGLNQAIPGSRFDVMGAKLTAGGGTGVSNNAPTQVIIPDGSGGASYQNDWPVGWGGGLATWDICGQGTFFSLYNTRSDIRLKKDITNMKESISERFMKLRPVTYLFKNETPEINGTQYGFIAQEVAQLFPTLVTKDPAVEGATIGMNYQGLIAPTIYVVQEQQKKIEQQQSQILELLKRIETLEKK